MRFLLIIFCLMFCTTQSFADNRVVVSVIFSSDIEQYQQSYQGFKEFLEQKGMILSVSKYNLKETDARAIVSQIKNKPPQIVLVLGSKALELAKKHIKDIPIVFSTVFQPDGNIGPNITGVSLDIPISMKLKGIKKILPDKKKIGMIYSSEKINILEILQTCKKLGFKPVVKKINSAKDFADTLAEISWQIDCFLMIPDPTLYFPQSTEYLLLKSLRQKFPVIGLSSFYTKAGALLSFDCNYNDSGQQAGEIALRILDGEKPVNIPLAEPGKITFSLNLSVAKRMNIKIPESIIKEANEVFGK